MNSPPGALFRSGSCIKRAALTSGKIVADFMRNEGRQTRAWPDFGGARNHHGEAPGGSMPAKLRT